MIPAYSMDSGGPCMVGRETVERIGIHQYRLKQYSQLTTPQSKVYITDLANVMPQLSISLAELGQLSLNPLTQKGKTEGVNRPFKRCQWYLLLGGRTWLKSTVLTVWMKILGVTQPGTGAWSPEYQSPYRLWHLTTTCVTERNNIKFNLRS